MPHLVLEKTPNVQSKRSDKELFRLLHGILVDTGGIPLGNCKSRAYISEDFLVADGQGEAAFVHLDVRFLEGRDEAVRTRIGRQMVDLLVDTFSVASEQVDFQLTVEVRETERAFYFKLPEGTL